MSEVDSIRTRMMRPVVEGLFAAEPKPHLIGGLRSNGSYVFPASLGGGDPNQNSEHVEQVALSRRGRLWSWTDTRYCPPPPFIPVTLPFTPFVVAAVELQKERMIILGQVVDGVRIATLRLGMEMELVVGPIGSEDEPLMVWKWAPVSQRDSELAHD